MAFLIKAEDGLFPPPLVRVEDALYDAIFLSVSKKAKPFLRRITIKVIQNNIAGKKIAFAGSRLKKGVGLTVEIKDVDPVLKIATACLVFPFWGEEREQKKALEAIKFQAKISGFHVDHCGLETKVPFEAEVEEGNQDIGNGNAQKYYRIKK